VAYYARTLEGQPKSAWQELEQHLAGVAGRASKSAGAFNSAPWGYCAGLWHDLGKYLPEFQARLEGSGKSVEHSGIGAAFAVNKHKDLGLPLAFAIAGHHAGLANCISSDSGLPTPLKERLRENARSLPKLLQLFPPWVASQQLPELPEWLSEPSADNRDEPVWGRRRFFGDTKRAIQSCPSREGGPGARLTGQGNMTGGLPFPRSIAL
jgi:CRISPR-associated endonuclease Cas3-HD